MSELKRRKKSLVAWVLIFAMVFSMWNTNWDMKRAKAAGINLDDENEIEVHVNFVVDGLNPQSTQLSETVSYNKETGIWTTSWNEDEDIYIPGWSKEELGLFTFSTLSGFTITSDKSDAVSMDTTVYMLSVMDLMNKFAEFAEFDHSGEGGTWENDTYVTKQFSYYNLVLRMSPKTGYDLAPGYKYLLLKGDFDYHMMDLDSLPYYQEHQYFIEQMGTSPNVEVAIFVAGNGENEFAAPIISGYRIVAEEGTTYNSETGTISIDDEDSFMAVVNLEKTGDATSATVKPVRIYYDYGCYETKSIIKDANGYYLDPYSRKDSDGGDHKALIWSIAEADGSMGRNLIQDGVWDNGKYRLPSGYDSKIEEGYYNSYIGVQEEYSFVPSLQKTAKIKVLKPKNTLAPEEYVEELMGLEEVSVNSVAERPMSLAGNPVNEKTYFYYDMTDLNAELENYPIPAKYQGKMQYQYTTLREIAGGDLYPFSSFTERRNGVDMLCFDDASLGALVTAVYVRPTLAPVTGYGVIYADISDVPSGVTVNAPEDWILYESTSTILSFIVPLGDSGQYSGDGLTVDNPLYEKDYEGAYNAYYGRYDKITGSKYIDPEDPLKIKLYVVQKNAAMGYPVEDFSLGGTKNHTVLFNQEENTWYGSISTEEEVTYGEKTAKLACKYELYSKATGELVADLGSGTSVMFRDEWGFTPETVANYKLKVTPYDYMVVNTGYERIFCPQYVEGEALEAALVKVPADDRYGQPVFPDVLQSWSLGFMDEQGQFTEIPGNVLEPFAPGAVAEIPFALVYPYRDKLVLNANYGPKKYTVKLIRMTDNGPEQYQTTTLTYGDYLGELVSNPANVPEVDLASGARFGGFTYEPYRDQVGQYHILDQYNPLLSSFDFENEDTISFYAIVRYPIQLGYPNYGTYENDTFSEATATALPCWPIDAQPWTRSEINYDEVFRSPYVLRFDCHPLEMFIEDGTEFHLKDSGQVEYKLVAYNTIQNDYRTATYKNYTGWETLAGGSEKIFDFASLYNGTYGEYVLLFRAVYEGTDGINQQTITKNVYQSTGKIIVDLKGPVIRAMKPSGAYSPYGNGDTVYTLGTQKFHFLEDDATGMELWVDGVKTEIEAGPAYTSTAGEGLKTLKVVDQYGNETTLQTEAIPVEIVGDAQSEGAFTYSIAEPYLLRRLSGVEDAKIRIKLGEDKVAQDGPAGLFYLYSNDAGLYNAVTAVQSAEDSSEYLVTLPYDSIKNGIKAQVRNVVGESVEITILTGGMAKLSDADAPEWTVDPSNPEKYTKSFRIGENLVLPTMQGVHATFTEWTCNGEPLAEGEKVSKDRTQYVAYSMPNTYRVTAENGDLYTMKVKKDLPDNMGTWEDYIDVTYYEDFYVKIIPAEGYEVIEPKLSLLGDEILEGFLNEDGSMELIVSAGAVTENASLSYTGTMRDTVAPEVTVKAVGKDSGKVYRSAGKGEEKTWFGDSQYYFYTGENIQFEIASEDNVGVSKISYLVRSKNYYADEYAYYNAAALRSEDEQGSVVWTVLSGDSVQETTTIQCASPNEATQYEYYFKIEDAAGNATYINMARVCFDLTSPEFLRVQDGQSTKITSSLSGVGPYLIRVNDAKDTGLLTLVMRNKTTGESQTIRVSNSSEPFEIPADNNTYELTVTDSCGNSNTVTVTAYATYTVTVVVPESDVVADAEKLSKAGWTQSTYQGMTAYVYTRPYYIGLGNMAEGCLTREGYRNNGWLLYDETNPNHGKPIWISADTDWESVVSIDWRDIAAPEVSLKVKETTLSSLWDTVSFTLFGKDDHVNVLLTASDNESSSEAIALSYFVSNDALNEAQLSAGTFDASFTPYTTDGFAVEAGDKYVYAKAVDAAGNAGYGRFAVRFDDDGPQFTLLEQAGSEIIGGITYEVGYGSLSFTVSDKTDDASTLIVADTTADTILTPDGDGKYTVSYDAAVSENRKLTVTDPAGNRSELYVTIKENTPVRVVIQTGIGSLSVADQQNWTEDQEVGGNFKRDFLPMDELVLPDLTADYATFLGWVTYDGNEEIAYTAGTKIYESATNWYAKFETSSFTVSGASTDRYKIEICEWGNGQTQDKWVTETSAGYYDALFIRVTPMTGFELDANALRLNITGTESLEGSLLDDGSAELMLEPRLITENTTIQFTGTVYDVQAPKIIKIAATSAISNVEMSVNNGDFTNDASTYQMNREDIVFTILAEDNAKVSTVSYFVNKSEKQQAYAYANAEALAAADAKELLTWTTLEYTEETGTTFRYSSFVEGEGAEFYFKVEDETGNASYANLPRFFTDSVNPVFTDEKGTALGKSVTVNSAFAFKVRDNSTVSVYDDGTLLEASEGGIYTIPVDNKSHTLVAIDEANLQTQLTVMAYYDIEVKLADTQKGYAVELGSNRADKNGQIKVIVTIDSGYEAGEPRLLYSQDGTDKSVSLTYNATEKYYEAILSVQGNIIISQVTGVAKTFVAVNTISADKSRYFHITALVTDSDGIMQEPYTFGNPIPENKNLLLGLLRFSNAEQTGDIVLDYMDEAGNSRTITFVPTQSNQFADGTVVGTIPYENGTISLTDVRGIAADTTAPVFVGIADKGVYSGDVTFTVTEQNLASVLDATTQKPVMPDEQGNYTVAADHRKHTLVASDTVGHQTVVEITIGELLTITSTGGEYTVFGVVKDIEAGTDVKLTLVAEEGLAFSDSAAVKADGIGAQDITCEIQSESTMAVTFKNVQNHVTFEVEGVAKYDHASVHFDALETGDQTFTQKSLSDTTYSVQLPTATKDGYTLAGWVLNGKKYQPGESVTLTYAQGNVVFAAMWSATISYQAGGKLSISRGVPYRVSATPNFRIVGDTTVYYGGIDFYASEDGEIEFE